MSNGSANSAASLSSRRGKMSIEKKEVRRRRRLAAVMVGFCLGLILLFTASSGLRAVLAGGGSSVVSGLTRGRDFIFSTVRGFMPLSAMERRRLEELQERVNNLEIELAAANQAREENRRLRELLEMPPPPEWRRVAALVIGRDPVSWNQRFRINRGEADGIEEGMAVTSEGQVIGRISEATARTAMVSTIADPEYRLSVRLQESDSTGVLLGGFQTRGRGERTLVLDYLPRDGNYASGEAVVTSGLSGLTPSGLPVGQTVAWDESQDVKTINGLYARLRAEPSADLSDFRVVSVLLREEGGEDR